MILIPVSTDETFTAYSSSIGEYTDGQDGITLEQLKVLGEKNEVDVSHVESMTPEERYKWLVEDVGYYTFDLLAVVDESKMDLIQIAADSLVDRFGGSQNSSDYEMFNRVVIAAAEKTIPFFKEGVIVCADY